MHCLNLVFGGCIIDGFHLKLIAKELLLMNTALALQSDFSYILNILSYSKSSKRNVSR